MEGILGHVRNAKVLRTYDFVDVVDIKNHLGWQVKSTLADTPVTWKRAKIADSTSLIINSEKSPDGCQALGDALIAFCNAHAEHSVRKFNLTQIGYARLILHKDLKATYFEKLIWSRERPYLFDAQEFKWKWSIAKGTSKKEQLTALHGTHKPSGAKWWAWHGRGENQLHFNGEQIWWPMMPTPGHARVFTLPSDKERLSIEQFIDLLAASSNPLPKT